jgi:hypothetical protein
MISAAPHYPTAQSSAFVRATTQVSLQYNTKGKRIMVFDEFN